MLALLLLACSPSVTCGPGTVLDGTTCVIAAAAADSAGDTGDDTASTDSAADTDTPLDTSDTAPDSGGDTDDTSPPADDGWPARAFAPYVDATAYPTVRIGEIPSENGTTHYTLAFVVAADGTTCTATWGTYYSIEDGPSAWAGGAEYTLYAQVDLLRARGGDVRVSFGGAANTPLEAACTSVEALVGELERVIDRLGLTRIDFDIEGPWVVDEVASARRGQALAALQARRPELRIGYTLPVLPSGLTPEGVRVVERAVADGVVLDSINVMTMDYGAGAAPDPAGRMGAYGIDALTALHAQLDTIYGGSLSDAELWARIGTTPMIGQNDVAGEVFTLDDAEETLAFARAQGLGLLSMWSINRDHPCAEVTAWAQPGCNGLVDVEDWAYARVFAAY